MRLRLDQISKDLNQVKVIPPLSLYSSDRGREIVSFLHQFDLEKPIKVSMDDDKQTQMLDI